MTEILFFGALFVGSHFALGAPNVRRQLVARLGEPGFSGFYSIVALFTLVIFVMSYSNQLSFDYWWGPAPEFYWITKLLMWLALVLAAGAFLAPNPSMSALAGGMESSDSPAMTPRGVQTITRHPFLWGTGLWGFSHMIANGDSKSVVFFGWFLLLGAFGAWILDWKKTQQLGDVWSLYCEQTSNVPFAALLMGRTKLNARDLLLPLVAGTALYAAVYWGHVYLAGVALF